MNTHSATPTQPLADVLTSVNAVAAAASRLLHNRRLHAGWRAVLDGLEFVPLHERPAHALQQVLFDTDQGTIEAYFSAPDLPSVGMSASHAGAVSPALYQLAAEALLQPVVGVLESIGFTSVSVDALAAVEGHVDDAPRHGWVRVQCGERSLGSFVCTQFPTAAIHRVRRRLEPAGFASTLARELAWRGSVTLSTRPVRRRVLDSIEQGDVLLLASGSDEQHFDCRVRFGARRGRHWSAAARVEESSLTIQGEGQMIDDDDGHDTEGEAADRHGTESATALRSIDVPVRFEIDTVAMPLAEIEAMSDGYVIELSTPLSAARIKLVACGRVIGSADLVAVGDRLGARITRMATHDASRLVS